MGTMHSPMGAGFSPPPGAAAEQPAPQPDVAGLTGAQMPTPPGPTAEDRREGLKKQLMILEQMAVGITRTDPSFEPFARVISNAVFGYMKTLAMQGSEEGTPQPRL